MLRRITLMLVLALSATSWAQTLSKTLPNGLKIIVKESHRAPTAVSRVWYKIGNVDGKPGKSGLNRALERMMFKGTKDVPSGEFNRRVSEPGGQNNAHTSRNETAYYESVAAANLPGILELKVDHTCSPNFNDKESLNEMNVVREEHRQRTEDTTDGKTREQAYLAAFTQPSMRASVIDYIRDLHALEADDLHAWYKRCYAPNNAVLAIVGGVDAKQTPQATAKPFGDVPAKAQPPRNKLHTKPCLRKPVAARVTSPVTHQSLIAINFRVPRLQELGDATPSALDILSDILADNASSRFDENLMHGKQTTLSVEAHYDIISRETPLFSVIAIPAEDVKTDILITQLRQEIRDIADRDISEEELQRVKIQATVNEIHARDPVSSQASMMSHPEAHGFRCTDEQEVHRRLWAVSAQKVQAAVRMLTGKRMSTAIIKLQKAAATPDKKTARHR